MRGWSRPDSRIASGRVPRAAALAAAVLVASVCGTGATSALRAQERPGSAATPPVREDPGLTARPTPGPVVPPRFYRAALERGTRSPDGSPGPRYWQAWSEYDLEARLDPASARVSGSGRIRYHNRSPDTLQVLALNLYQNLHAPGVVRNEPQEVTGGATLERVVAGGRPLREGSLADGPSYVVQGTILVIRPPAPVLPGGTADLEIDWAFTVPRSGGGRVGHSEGGVFFVGYWFPKMAVYDDLRGWDAEPYMGNAEFHDGFGDYRVSLTVPGGWTVMATGELENPETVLSHQTVERLRAAARADTIVRIVTEQDRRSATATAPGVLTYRFAADSVRDFAWSASDVQLWYATSAEVPDRDGDGAPDRVLIHSFWRPDRAPLWSDQALYGKHSVEHHSRYTGLAYPWPHMTSVEGADIIGGGMEFPMMTVIGPYTGRRPEDLYNVTSHEIAHMWVPMIVATNERRHAWMDEGATTFLENESRPEYWPGDEAHAQEAATYLSVARAELEQPLMRHGDYYEPGPGYSTASYAKPATLFVVLRGLLGEGAFERAYRTFIREWAYKHPTPWDLFATFERFGAQDMDWFWTAWYYETWRLDQAVAGVLSGPDGPVVVLEDRGWAPMPVLLKVETTRGGTVHRELPPDAWLRGETRLEVRLPAEVGEVTRVEIDPDGRFPDVDRSNNAWERR